MLIVEIDDILFDSTLETQHSGAIVTLKQPPVVRNRESIPKTRQNKSKREH
ncbi:MAG: hypothetical protein AAF298_07715 [Cyanobacteria bacterium P01_A01_bin.40]